MNLKLFLSVVVAMTGLCGARMNAAGLTVHEWGTFTSFQAGDSKLLSWLPLETARLPDFVYNWSKPGPAQRTATFAGGGKFTMMALQRLETPVVYFYSDKAQQVDVRVQFPQGGITEWYPAADSIRMGLADGAIHWQDIEIQPPRHATEGLSHPASGGNHYFAARETDANLVKTKDEVEKFLFYRGLGNFETPLRVTMQSDFSITISNTGTEAISQLFVFDADSRSGSFRAVPGLRPGEERTVSAPRLYKNASRPGDDLASAIGKAMAKALAREGLYPREAQAMVDTWKDSWFKEEGVRVMYILPRPWTDRTLPITLRPAPEKMVRVMVGRAEVLRPGVEQRLVSELSAARDGGKDSADAARRTLKSLGRFAAPAFAHAMAQVKGLDDAQRAQLSALLSNQLAFE